MIEIWLAFLLDYIAGDPLWFPHPVRLMGKYISWWDRHAVKRWKGQRFWGLCMAITLVLVSFLLPAILLYWLFHVSAGLGLAAHVLLLWTCIALRCLDKEVMKVYESLKKGQVLEARKQVSYLVSRDTQSLDEEGIIKAAVETGVENISDGVIAPLFYMLIGGAPLAMAYKAINTMDSMVGYQNERYQEFGYFPAKLDDIANFIPARLTGWLMVFTAFLAQSNYKGAVDIMKRDHHKSKSPNAGWPEAAFAGAEGIQLLGPSFYFGKLVEKPYIGDALRPIGINHIKRTRIYMYASAFLLLLAGTVLRCWLGGRGL